MRDLGFVDLDATDLLGDDGEIMDGVVASLMYVPNTDAGGGPSGVGDTDHVQGGCAEQQM
jgi:hypothetical protein